MSIARDVGGWLPSASSGQALGQVPLLGSFLADAYQACPEPCRRDNVWADMRRRLTPQEIDTFTEVTRRYPDTLALLTTFQRLPAEAGIP